MNYIHDDCLSLIRRFLFDIQLMEDKIKNEIAIALINKIKGKLYSFCFKFDDNDKSGNLEKALFSYKKAIKIIILNNEKKIMIMILMKIQMNQLLNLKSYFLIVNFVKIV